jgi:hypothetical protein
MKAHDRPVVLKADPAYRRRVLVVYATCVPVALALFILLRQWGLPTLVEHLRRADDDLLRLFKMLSIASMAIPLGACVYLFRLGRRIQTSEQVPLPGTKVIRDTPVVAGPDARRLGMTIVGLSVVAALLVVFVAVRFARL